MACRKIPFRMFLDAYICTWFSFFPDKFRKSGYFLPNVIQINLCVLPSTRISKQPLPLRLGRIYFLLLSQVLNMLLHLSLLLFDLQQFLGSHCHLAVRLQLHTSIRVYFILAKDCLLAYRSLTGTVFIFAMWMLVEDFLSKLFALCFVQNHAL